MTFNGPTALALSKTVTSNVFKPFQIEPERVEIDRDVETIRGNEDEEDLTVEEGRIGRSWCLLLPPPSAS